MPICFKCHHSFDHWASSAQLLQLYVCRGLHRTAQSSRNRVNIDSVLDGMLAGCNRVHTSTELLLTVVLLC